MQARKGAGGFRIKPGRLDFWLKHPMPARAKNDGGWGFLNRAWASRFSAMATQVDSLQIWRPGQLMMKTMTMIARVILYVFVIAFVPVIALVFVVVIVFVFVFVFGL